MSAFEEVEEKMREWDDAHMAEACLIVMAWFTEKGRTAAKAVSDAIDDITCHNFEEGISWLEDIESGRFED